MFDMLACSAYDEVDDDCKPPTSLELLDPLLCAAAIMHLVSIDDDLAHFGRTYTSSVCSS
jgi:hypothetical protein